MRYLVAHPEAGLLLGVLHTRDGSYPLWSLWNRGMFTRGDNHIPDVFGVASASYPDEAESSLHKLRAPHEFLRQVRYVPVDSEKAFVPMDDVRKVGINPFVPGMDYVWR